MAATQLFFVFGTVFFAFSLVSKRIENTVVTGPMLFAFAGLLLGLTSFGIDSMALSR